MMPETIDDYLGPPRASLPLGPQSENERLPGNSQASGGDGSLAENRIDLKGTFCDSPQMMPVPEDNNRVLDSALDQHRTTERELPASHSPLDAGETLPREQTVKKEESYYWVFRFLKKLWAMLRGRWRN